MASKVLAVALLALFAIAQASHDFSGPNTVELTAANYESLTNNGKVHLIAYFAPWCGHCKRLAPTWKELGDKLAGTPGISIAFIDCTAHRDICTKADIKGYPTIKIVHKSEEYKVYKGARDTESLAAAIKEAAAELLTEST